jgi:hypothetical protein
MNIRCISVPWDMFSSVGLVARFFQTSISSDLPSVIFTPIRTSHYPMFCGFFSLVCLVLQLALFYQRSETIMETLTKEVFAIGKAAVDQNMPRSTTRPLCNIFLYSSESTIFENSNRIFKLYRFWKFVIIICRHVWSCPVCRYGRLLIPSSFIFRELSYVKLYIPFVTVQHWVTRCTEYPKSLENFRFELPTQKQGKMVISLYVRKHSVLTCSHWTHRLHSFRFLSVGTHKTPGVLIFN